MHKKFLHTTDSLFLLQNEIEDNVDKNLDLYENNFGVQLMLIILIRFMEMRYKYFQEVIKITF